MMDDKHSQNNQGQTELAESQYLKLSSRHPLFIQLSDIADQHGTTWQDEARQAITLYCLLHRLGSPALAIAKS